MRVGIFGSTGMLGCYISNYLQHKYDCYLYSRAQYDILENDRTKLKDLIRDKDVIINCTGVLKPYIKHMLRSDVITINATFPQQLSEICMDEKIEMLHVCSDCVFNGKKGKYTEMDVPDATDIYAMTKSIIPSQATVLRTSIIGEDLNPNGVGFMNWLLRSNSDIITGYTNCMWNGVTCLQLAKLVDGIIKNQQFTYGIRNIFSPTILSKYDLCKIIKKTYKLQAEIRPVVAKSISNDIICKTLDRSLNTVFPEYMQNISDAANNDFYIKTIEEQI